MNQIGTALLEEPEPIRSLYVYSSNPAIVAPESNKVREGLPAKIYSRSFMTCL